VAIGHEDHGGIALAVPVALGGLCQALDLSVGQILPRPQFGIGFADWRDNCSFFGGWRYQFQMRFSHGFPRSPQIDCSNNDCFTNSGKS
jgi:hypothetical protein